MQNPIILASLALLAVLVLACGPSATAAPLTATTTTGLNATPNDNPRATVIPTSMPAVTSAPTPKPPSELTLYEELLSVLPNSPEIRSKVVINDYARVREVFDVPPLDPNPSDEEWSKYVIATGIPGSWGPWISGYSRYAGIFFENRESLGTT